MLFKKLLPKHLRFLLSFTVLSMIIFLIFRLILLLNNFTEAKSTPISDLLIGFFDRGTLYDFTTTMYIISLPLLTFNFIFLFNKEFKILYKVFYYFLLIISIVSILICSANLNYYEYYGSHITQAVFSWTDNFGLMFKTMFGNIYFYFGIISFFILIGIFIFFFKKIYNKTIKEKPIFKFNIYKRILIFILTNLVLFFGVRGDIDLSKKPILIEDAFITRNAFANQIGLNGTFHLIHSIENGTINYFEKDEIAVDKVKKYFNINQKYDSPIAREENLNDTARKFNVILVIMESMSYDMFDYSGKVKNITPYLDSISDKGLLFTNVFTAGIHTYNGIFSTTYGLPALMHTKPTVSSAMSSKKYSGLPNLLHSQGYKNIFFFSHPKEFDNMNSFLPLNDIDTIIDETHYKKDEIVSCWGVADHTIFNRSIEVLNHLNKENKKFFATILTSSTHSPYTIPKNIDFSSKEEDPLKKAYQYADWAIGNFIENAKKQTWFDSTIFVFIADHGQKFNVIYDMPLSYHHTPLIIYAPKLIKPQIIKNPGLQIDVTATIMGLLKIPYINNTLGIDLINNKREYAYFSADNKIGVVNDEFYLIIHNNGKEQMFNYKKQSTENIIESHKNIADSMKIYTYSMLQTMQYLLKNNFTNYKTIKHL